jgi:hypothetical protein
VEDSSGWGRVLEASPAVVGLLCMRDDAGAVMVEWDRSPVAEPENVEELGKGDTMRLVGKVGERVVWGGGGGRPRWRSPTKYVAQMSSTGFGHDFKAASWISGHGAPAPRAQEAERGRLLGEGGV